MPGGRFFEADVVPKNGVIGAVNYGIVARNGADGAIKTAFITLQKSTYPLRTAQGIRRLPVEPSLSNDPVRSRLYSLRWIGPAPNFVGIFCPAIQRTVELSTIDIDRMRDAAVHIYCR